MTEFWVSLVLLKTTKTQHKMAQAIILLEAAPAILEPWSHCDMASPSALPGLLLHSAGAKRTIGRPKQPAGPNTRPSWGTSRFPIKSCVRQRDRGIRLRKRWGEEEERRAHYGGRPGDGVCAGAAPAGAGAPGAETPWGPGAVRSHIRPN